MSFASEAPALQHLKICGVFSLEKYGCMLLLHVRYHHAVTVLGPACATCEYVNINVMCTGVTHSAHSVCAKDVPLSNAVHHLQSPVAKGQAVKHRRQTCAVAARALLCIVVLQIQKVPMSQYLSCVSKVLQLLLHCMHCHLKL